MKSPPKSMEEDDDSVNDEEETTIFKMKSRSQTEDCVSTAAVATTKEEVTYLDQLPLMISSCGIVDFFSSPYSGAYASTDVPTAGGNNACIHSSWPFASPTSLDFFTEYFKERTTSAQAVQLDTENSSPVPQRIRLSNSTWETQERSSAKSSILGHTMNTEHQTSLFCFTHPLSITSSPLQTSSSNISPASSFALTSLSPSSTCSHPHTICNSQYLSGIVDRYNLMAMDTGGNANITSSGLGILETHSPPCQNEISMSPSSEFSTKFMKHSMYAGDLILGSRNYVPFGSKFQRDEHNSRDVYVGTGDEFGLGLTGMAIGESTLPISGISRYDGVLSDVDHSVHGLKSTTGRLGGHLGAFEVCNQHFDLAVNTNGHHTPKENEGIDDGRKLKMEFSLDNLADLLGSGWDLNFDVDMECKVGLRALSRPDQARI
ncbi:hypothetical protein H0H92_006080 [Tricholoma furcatifolium]|nr:hypothetical protein H0H92_006080 [Tricholoma furcatifolium]